MQESLRRKSTGAPFYQLLTRSKAASSGGSLVEGSETKLGTKSPALMPGFRGQSFGGVGALTPTSRFAFSGAAPFATVWNDSTLLCTSAPAAPVPLAFSDRTWK